MAPAGGYDEDYEEDEFDTAPPPDDQSDDDDDDEWGLFSSSSPSSSSPIAAPAAPTLPPNLSIIKPPTIPPSSPECSMDDDSSSDGDEEVRAPRRTATTPASAAQLAASQATTIQQRRAKVKELESKYRHECLALCCELRPLQQQWRQELEDPVPGLISFHHLKQEEAVNQKDFSRLKSETHIQNSGMSMHKSGATSAATSDFKSMPDMVSSIKRAPRAPLRKRLPWRANEREAIRRGILMFGVGRSEKVRGAMLGSLKHVQHGLLDIADCCWEFVRACSVFSDVNEIPLVENWLSKAEESGIEMGPEVSERVGQWDKIEKSGPVWLKRIKLLDSLSHVIKLCGHAETQEVVYTAIDSLRDATVPCAWWTRESDLALLAGVYKHGFGNYEALRTDEQFMDAFEPAWEEREVLSGHKGASTSRAFMDHDSDADMNSRDSGGQVSWPDSNVLTRRLKRLVEHLSRLAKQFNAGRGRPREKLKESEAWMGMV